MYSFHRLGFEAYLSGPHRAAGRAGANPTTGSEKGALSQTLRVCRATSWGRRFAGPCRQRPRPAHGTGARRASHPPEPSLATLAGGSCGGAARARPGGRSTWLGREGRALATGQSPAMGHGREAHTQYALPPATRVTRPPAAAWWAGARLNGAPIVASAKARRTLAAGQSPAMGHGRGALVSVTRSGGLKPFPLPGHGRACGKA